MLDEAIQSPLLFSEINKVSVQSQPTYFHIYLLWAQLEIVSAGFVYVREKRLETMEGNNFLGAHWGFSLAGSSSIMKETAVHKTENTAALCKVGTSMG